MASRLAMWPRTSAPRWCAASIPAVISSRGHFGLLARGHGAVAAGDEHLDDLGALLDLLAHGPAEFVGSVGTVDGAAGADVPVPREALVARVPRRADVAAAGHEAGTGEQPFRDGGLHGRVDGKGRAGADRAGEAAAQQQLEMVRRPHGLQRRRLLQTERGRLGAELVVGGVEVAAHHSGHDGAPVEVDHPVLRGRSRSAVARCATVAMRRSSTTTSVRGRAPSASRTVASRRTSLGTAAAVSWAPDAAPVPFSGTEGTIVTRTRRPRGASAAWPAHAAGRSGDARRRRHRAVLGHTRDRHLLPRAARRRRGRRVHRDLALGARLPGGPDAGLQRPRHPPVAGRPRPVRWPSSTPAGRGSRARPRSTFRPSSTPSGSSGSASASCSPSPRACGRAR